MRHGAVAEEDTQRAQYYRLLSRLLAAPPDEGVIALVAELAGSDTPLGGAVSALGRAARETTADAARQEFHDLFIGVGRGELVPFGSYYLAGFLMEKPLAELRGDMAELGIERADGVSEPEDHIASVCEIMAATIEGRHGLDVDAAHQTRFFDRNVGPWAGRFFQDLETAESAAFYRAVGALGREFLAIESAAIRMAA